MAEGWDQVKPLTGLKLEIGGGGHPGRPGWVNVDLAEGADILWDLEKGLPAEIGDGTCAQVEAIDVLEHIRNLLPLMEDIHRVLRPGGTLYARVPYWRHPNAVIDPTHVRFFDPATFTQFFTCTDRPYLKRRWEVLGIEHDAAEIRVRMRPVKE